MSSRSNDTKYVAPPIIDAVIEIRFENAISDDIREKVSAALSDDYPLVEELKQQTVSVSISNESVTTSTNLQDTITKRTSIDRPNTVQIGSYNLFVSRGSPYNDWSEILNCLVSSWGKARKVWGFRKIARLGVRYINRLDISPTEEGVIAYEDYLTLRINLPETFPLIDSYALTLEAKSFKNEFGMRVQSGTTAPAVPGRLSFLLDIDVWLDTNLPQKEASLYDKLDQMRALKNELFETFITSKAREAFSGR